MSYWNRFYMAASVAAVQTNGDGGAKLSSGLRSLQFGKGRLASGGILPLAGLGVSRAVNGTGGKEEQAKTTKHILYSWSTYIWINHRCENFLRDG
ncbi:hypothetical protein IHE45_15G127800 [Dioscorea alata]|uniref:Uncharacterized protein n=1 Tax=Dioscorea alata TaxID=55571 RepID=A0ACB7UPB8_DIOAL|nr:hypothetical protein IHE45_15G127800 [Dioscorea alata]